MAFISNILTVAFERLNRKVHSVFKRFQKEPEEPDYVPKKWKNKKSMVAAPGGSRLTKAPTPIRYSEPLMPGKRRIPFLKNLNRGLAGLSLIVNFVFAEVLLGSSFDGKIFFLLFLLNSYVCMQYLWKTRGGIQ